MKAVKARTPKANGKAPAAPTDTGTGDLKFYRSNEKPYGPFSNLFRCAIAFEDRIFPTAEHAYQAGKALKPAVREWILQAPSPSLAAMAAHGLYTWDIVPNWASIKVDRMRAVLRAKFIQHPELRELLLGTANRRLVEAGTTNNAVNRFWGEVDGKGENTLGKLLMELRDELRGHKGGAKPATKAVTKTVRGKKPADRQLAA